MSVLVTINWMLKKIKINAQFVDVWQVLILEHIILAKMVAYIATQIIAKRQFQVIADSIILYHHYYSDQCPKMML